MTTTMPEAARAAIRGLPHDAAWKVLAAGLGAGRWGWEVFEAHSARTLTPEPPPQRPRLPAKTRLRRWDERPTVPSNRFVQKRSLDPTLDWEVNDGAFRCLDLLIALAGKAGEVTTFTSSLAKQLGRTTRTVQNYYRALVAAGYIEHSFDRSTGRVHIRLTARCRPPAFPTEGAKTSSGINLTQLYPRESPRRPHALQQGYPQKLWINRVPPRTAAMR